MNREFKSCPVKGPEPLSTFLHTNEDKESTQHFYSKSTHSNNYNSFPALTATPAYLPPLCRWSDNGAASLNLNSVMLISQIIIITIFGHFYYTYFKLFEEQGKNKINKTSTLCMGTNFKSLFSSWRYSTFLVCVRIGLQRN